MHWAQGFYIELERAGWQRGNSSGMNQQTSSRKGRGEEHWVWQRALNFFHYINVFCDMHRTHSCLSIYLSNRTKIEEYFSSQIAPATIICPAWHIVSANSCNEMWPTAAALSALHVDAGSAIWHWENSQMTSYAVKKKTSHFKVTAMKFQLK